jgi:glycosyltransferase involved in cell wall biosynthesis
VISLIIPTHDDESRLVEALDALIPASMEALIRELIVVDAGSTDATLAIAEDAGAILAASLDDAVERAKGPWLLVLEPRVVLQPGWEEPVRSHIRQRRTAARFRVRGGGLFGPKPVALLVLKEAARGRFAGVGNRLQQGIGRIGKIDGLVEGARGVLRR